MADVGKQEQFFPVNGLESSKKYGFVKGVGLQSLTLAEKTFINANPSVLVFHGLGELRVQPKESLDVLFVGEGFSETSNAEAWGRVCDVLAPGGYLKVKFPEGVTTQEEAASRLLLGGFINSIVSSNLIAAAEKPTWKPSAALPLKKKNKSSAWKVEMKTDDVVDEDALLDENDCGGTISGDGVTLSALPVKKKACKNCSCGLAEAEKAAVQIEVVDESAVEEKSNGGCGNCAKGDAFRCGGCPYLGLPTFTPGTKPDVKLNTDGTKSLMVDLTSDI